MLGILHKLVDDVVRTQALRVTDAHGKTHLFGTERSDIPTPHVRVNARAERNIALDPSLKLAEAYMDGDLEMLEGDIYDLLRAVLCDVARVEEMHPRLNALLRVRGAMYRMLDRNGLTRARQNVAHHYDLSTELYELFLDEDRQYSCAYFPTSDTDLDTAQTLKKRHIAAKMHLNREGLEVLDIGCGWGGMARYLAGTTGARVKGVTLSTEQHAYATARSAELGYGDRTEYELKDYRTLQRDFDRIVSVGMFEHVGKSQYDTFFNKVAELLRPDGVMLLHTIGHAGPPAPTAPFIRKYIFPGGYIPTLDQIAAAAQRAGLYMTDVENLRLHYAMTLRNWRQRFLARWDDAARLYDERFCRMWDFYLAASEAAFRWRGQVVYQVQLTHQRDAVPLTRDYIAQAEARLAEAEERLEPQRISG